MDEVDVIAGLQSGDSDVTRQVWERFAPDIQRVIECRWPASLEQKESAEDVAQSVFRTFFRRMQEGLFPNAVSGTLFVLLFVIARRKIGKRIRWWDRGCRTAKREVQLRMGSRAGGDDPADGAPTPGEAAEAAELVAAFRAAVASLEDDRERLVVELFLQERSISEIAEKIERSPVRVRQILRDAVENLKRKLKED